MKLLGAGLFTISLLAQEPFQVELDLRHRFVIGDRGDVYRSIVNLGEGVRVFGFNLHYEGKDSIDARANGWGGDPNSDATLRLRREKVYDIFLQYRTMAYFNNLPSYANPLFAQGALASQRAMDVRRQQFDLDMKWKPKARVSPFFAVLRTNGDGSGVTPFVGSGDEFPVYTTFGDTLTTVRGGAQLTGSLWSATLELGRIGYTDQQELNSTGNAGNRTDDVTLDRLAEKYDASGDGLFTRALFQAQPFSSLGFSGHYVYSKPHLEASHSLTAEGRFLDPATRYPYSSLQEQSVSEANRPHNSGSWSTEFRPRSKLRLRHTWFSDAFQISGASPTAALLTDANSARSRLNLRYDQSESDISLDLGASLTLRGGHRYVRGEADLPPADLVFTPPPDASRMNRHVALAGASWRHWRGRVRLHADFEGSPGGETYFRTGLQDYRKLAIQAQFKVTKDLQLTVLRKTLTNTNIGIDFSSSQNAATLDWSPGRNRRIILSGTYSYEDIRSDATFLDPRVFLGVKSEYWDHGHHAGGFAELRIARGAFFQAGGAISTSGGTRPTRYYSPQSRVIMPLYQRVNLVAEYHLYSYRSFEAFRAHTVSAGLQLRWRQ
jgi:hypothetical protein